MPSKNEHSISITGDTYTAFRDYCKAQGVPMNVIVDAWTQEFAPFTNRTPRGLLRNKTGKFLRQGDDPSTAVEPKRAKSKTHPIDPQPVDRPEKIVELKGSDIVEPSSEDLVPFEKKPLSTGGIHEF